MTNDFRAQVIDPFAAFGNAETGPFPFEMFERKFLAQGDSWFSIGSFPPGLTSSIVLEMRLSKSSVIVNCARPGKTLSHMVDRVREPMFLRHLTGRLASKWDAIFFSGGGNDLIDAASVKPDAPLDKRLFLTRQERGAVPLAGAEYVSPSGWATFEQHLSAVFQLLMAARSSGVNKLVPLVLHNYAPVMPRPAPAGAGSGPWLQPALVAFDVAEADWQAVAEALMTRLDTLLRRLIADHLAAVPQDRVLLVDSQSAGLVIASSADHGVSGDWLNEIHPTRAGYRKLAAAWRSVVDPLL